MSADTLLSRLGRVTQHGTDRWRAICPAHETKHRTQSLAIRELGDGTLLVKCFAGCDASAITAAVGMDIRDLFPRGHKAPADPRKPQRAKHWHAMREAVITMRHEVLLVAVAADNIVQGAALTPEDIDRVALAAGRIRSAIEACT